MTVTLANAYNKVDTSGGTLGSLAVTFTNAITAGQAIVLMVAYSSATTPAAISSVSDTVNGAYTLVGTVNSADGKEQLAVYKFESSASAAANANTATVTWVNSTTNVFPGMNVFVCSGAASSGIIDLFKTGSATGTAATTGSGSTARAGELGLCFCYADNDATASGTGWTGITGADPDANGSWAEQQAVASSGTSVQGAVTVNSGQWTIAMVTVQPAAAAASSDIVPMTGGGRNPRNSTYLRMKQSARSGLYVPEQVSL